jgi:hypothetical protein
MIVLRAASFRRSCPNLEEMVLAGTGDAAALLQPFAKTVAREDFFSSHCCW